WAKSNIATFVGHCVYIDGFMLRTTTGKGCVPDGFAFALPQKEWFLVEYELLGHGVWPHIAEQITRFVVALQNPSSLREIRNKLFAYILQSNMTSTVASQLNIPTECLLQQLELFIESTTPTILILIDDTNPDLTDFAHALDSPTQIYRVRKLLVNGAVEYYS